jgi:hypothetical protein
MYIYKVITETNEVNNELLYGLVCLITYVYMLRVHDEKVYVRSGGIPLEQEPFHLCPCLQLPNLCLGWLNEIILRMCLCRETSIRNSINPL